MMSAGYRDSPALSHPSHPSVDTKVPLRPSARQIRAAHADDKEKTLALADKGDQQTTDEDEAHSDESPCCQCIHPSNLGCVERLFDLLSARSVSGPPVQLSIPSTLVFSPSAPTSWYSTHSSGSLISHTAESITVERILEEFAPGVFDSPPIPAGLEAVAGAIIRAQTAQPPMTLTALQPDSTEIYAQFIYSSTYSLPAGQNYIVYLTALELVRLLRDVNPDLHRPRVFGLLQRFIPPTGKSHTGAKSAHQQLTETNHHLYKVLWSPHYTSIEFRINHTRYRPQRAASSNPLLRPPSPSPSELAESLFNKLATFDGPATCSKLSQVTQASQRAIFEKLCTKVVRRIEAQHTHMRMKYMELFVKLDGGRAVLLYARSLRAIDMRAVFAGASDPSIPSIQCLECCRAVDFTCGDGSQSESPWAARLRESDDGNDDRHEEHNSMQSADGGKSARQRHERHASATRFNFEEKTQGANADTNIDVDADGDVDVDGASSRGLVSVSDTRRVSPLSSSGPVPVSPPRRPRTPAPLHLRNHPTSFHSIMTPYELSASIDFDLLAPLPDTSTESGRPDLVARVLGESPNVRRRTDSFTRPHSAISSTGRANGKGARGEFKDVLGLYTRDIHASRRRALRVALDASRPQATSRSYARAPPTPTIAIGKFLDPQLKPRDRTNRPGSARPGNANEAEIPTLADMIRGTSTPTPAAAASSPSRSASRPTTGVAHTARAPSHRPSPLSVWNAHYHAGYYNRVRASAGSHTARDRPPALRPLRPHFRSVGMTAFGQGQTNNKPPHAPVTTTDNRPSKLIPTNTPAVQRARQTGQPAKTGPSLTASEWHRHDPDEILPSAQEGEPYIPNPFGSTNAARPQSAARTRQSQPPAAMALRAPSAAIIPPEAHLNVRFPSPPQPSDTPATRTHNGGRKRFLASNPFFRAEQILNSHASMLGSRVDECDEEDSDGAADVAAVPVGDDASGSDGSRSCVDATRHHGVSNGGVEEGGGGTAAERNKLTIRTADSTAQPTAPQPTVNKRRPITYAEVEAYPLGQRAPQPPVQSVPSDSSDSQRALPTLRSNSTRSSLSTKLNLQLSSAAAAAAAATARLNSNSNPHSDDQPPTPNRIATEPTPVDISPEATPIRTHRHIQRDAQAHQTNQTHARNDSGSDTQIDPPNSILTRASTSSLSSSCSSDSYGGDGDFASVSSSPAVSRVAATGVTDSISSAPMSPAAPPLPSQTHAPLHGPPRTHANINALSPVADPIDDADDDDVELEYASDHEPAYGVGHASAVTPVDAPPYAAVDSPSDASGGEWTLTEVSQHADQPPWNNTDDDEAYAQEWNEQEE